MTIVIVNPEHTAMYADSICSTDNHATINRDKCWVAPSGMIIGGAGAMETHALRIAENPAEVLAALDANRHYFRNSALLLIFEGKAYQAFVEKEDGASLVHVVGSIAVGGYRSEWLNYATANGANTSPTMFAAVARTFCTTINSLWGMATVAPLILRVPPKV